MVTELRFLRKVYLRKAVTPGWDTATVHFTLKIDYNFYCDSFEMLQVKVIFRSSARPVCPVPRTLNKQYSARSELNSVLFKYFT